MANQKELFNKARNWHQIYLNKEYNAGLLHQAQKAHVKCEKQLNNAAEALNSCLTCDCPIRYVTIDDNIIRIERNIRTDHYIGTPIVNVIKVEKRD